jgi:hypothetical protein
MGSAIIVHLHVLMLGIISISICWHQTNMDNLCHVATIAAKLKLLVDTDELMLAFSFSLPNVTKHELKHIFLLMVLKMTTQLEVVHYWDHQHRYHCHYLNQRPKQAKVSLNSMTILIKYVFLGLFLFLFLPFFILSQFLY